MPDGVPPGHRIREGLQAVQHYSLRDRAGALPPSAPRLLRCFRSEAWAFRWDGRERRNSVEWSSRGSWPGEHDCGFASELWCELSVRVFDVIICCSYFQIRVEFVFQLSCYLLCVIWWFLFRKLKQEGRNVTGSSGECSSLYSEVLKFDPQAFECSSPGKRDQSSSSCSVRMPIK